MEPYRGCVRDRTATQQYRTALETYPYRNVTVSIPYLGFRYGFGTDMAAIAVRNGYAHASDCGYKGTRRYGDEVNIFTEWSSL